jgi:hypothetical protein
VSFYRVVKGEYRVVKGERDQLASTNVKVAANYWHTLALKAEGDRFTVSFDGKPLISAQDRTFPDAGEVARCGPRPTV